MGTFNFNSSFAMSVSMMNPAANMMNPGSGSYRNSYGGTPMPQPQSYNKRDQGSYSAPNYSTPRREQPVMQPGMQPVSQPQVQVQYVEVPGPVQYVEGPVQYIEREGKTKTKTVIKEVPECSSCGWVGVISQPCSITFYAFSCPGVCSNPVIF